MTSKILLLYSEVYLLITAGEAATTDMKKADMLNSTFASVFNDNHSCHVSLAPES